MTFVGDFMLKANVKSSEVEANKPVELTLSLEGYGALDSLDLAKFDTLEGVTVYKDEPIKKRVYKSRQALYELYSKDRFYL